MVAWGLVALMAVAAAVFVPIGVRSGGVLGAAGASVGALWLGALVALFVVRQQFGASLALPTALRVGLGVAVTLLLPLLWEPSGLVQGIIALALVAGFNLIFLVATRELGADDLSLARRVLGR